MKHMLYLDTDGRVCEKPQRLDEFEAAVYTEVLKAGDRDHTSCPECMLLITARNERAYREEQELWLINEKVSVKTVDHMDPARGVLLGVLVASVMWVMLILLFRWLS